MAEIIAESKYLTLGKGASSHSSQSSVEFLGFILAGKIKVTHEDEDFEIDGVKKKSFSKYYMHQKKSNNHNYVSYLQVGECIGLEEYLWEVKFKSSGEVISHDAKVLYIPESLFSSKFN